MRRSIPSILVALSILGAAPVLAADADPSAEPSVGAAELVRTEAPHVGLAMAFPADWRVSLPEGLRLSALSTADGGEVMETTAISANGPDAWCNVDVYLALDAPLQGHALAYANLLAESAGAESSMVVVDHELAAGPSVRIEILDPERGRSRSYFLFDGPPAADGTVNRFLLTCAAPADAGPFWVDIAESAEVFEPVAPEASPAVGSAEGSPAAERPDSAAEE